MHTTEKPIGFWSAVSMGIGAMVGAGIFALLGEASAIAGSAVYLSFIAGGVIALFSGYSLGKLGAAFPSSGGIVEYLSQAWGVGFFTGTMSIMLYIAALVSLSLIAKAFGNYAATFITHDPSPAWRAFFACAIVALFVAVNLEGAREVSFWERLIVAIKFAVLCVMSAAGIFFLDPALLSPAHYPPASNVLYSLAITFFAFEGFRVITNTAEDMPDPATTLPRAMMAAIVIVMGLYVAISFAVFGNLDVNAIIAARDFALARAATPIFGQLGFTVVAITALIATASAINANLYAATNVTYQLAKDGELPQAFGKPIGHSREGLVISGLLVVVLSLLFDLGEIATIGSISVLFIHLVTHLGHLRIIKRTGASRIMVALAALLSFAAMVLAGIYACRDSWGIVFILLGFVLFAALSEVTLQKLARREVRPRIA